MATAVSVDETPSPEHNGTLACCALLSPSSGGGVAVHRPPHREAEHPRAGGAQPSTSYQDPGQRQPVRSPMGDVLSTPRAAVGAAGVCGISCESLAPAAGALPHLPPSAPVR